MGLVKPNSPTKNGREEMSRTARERASSRGAYAYPKRAMPVRGPRASAKALPRARKVSSVV